MTIIRIVLGVVGGLLICYGAARLLHGLPGNMLALLAGWLVAALIIQLAVLSPLLVAIGAGVRGLPDRGRGFVQAGLIIVGSVTLIAIPLMLRQFSQPPVKAMLLQDYRVNLLLLVVIIAAGLCFAYAYRVNRDRQRP